MPASPVARTPGPLALSLGGVLIARSNRPYAASPPAACRLWSTLLLGVLLPACGCSVLGEKPSNFRDWSPDEAVLSYAEVSGDLVHVYNIRNCSYLTQDTYVVHHYDKTYDLNDLRSVDFIVVPFRGSPSLAHTMLSFGFAGDDYLAVSVEIRKEKGEKYEFLKGILNRYELLYVLGDERDLVRLRTNYRGDDVYVYRTRTTPEKARSLFLDVIGRVNQLAAKPEFYNSFTNNCTTNIMGHINHLAPGTVPYTFGVLFPGYSDRLAYRLGLLEPAGTFAETRRRASVGELARKAGDAPDFSARIRR
jgi:hypothetical protein